MLLFGHAISDGDIAYEFVSRLNSVEILKLLGVLELSSVGSQLELGAILKK